MADIKAKKKKLRQELLNRRNALSEEMYHAYSARIRARIKGLDAYRQSHRIHCYVSMNSRNEVDTRPLIEEMLQSGKEVVVPVTQFEDGTLRHVLLTSTADLEPNKWGVPEPVRGEEVNPETVELVLVPMAGGDPDRNRIGYGKGFYDRFLQKVSALKVGLLFECCLVSEGLPVEDFDVPLDTLVTEKRVLS